MKRFFSSKTRENSASGTGLRQRKQTNVSTGRQGIYGTGDPDPRDLVLERIREPTRRWLAKAIFIVAIIALCIALICDLINGSWQATPTTWAVVAVFLGAVVGYYFTK